MAMKFKLQAQPYQGQLQKMFILCYLKSNII